MSGFLMETKVVSYESFPARFLSVKVDGGGSCFRIHWHERIEFLHIDSGEMHIVCGEESFVASAGDFVTFHGRKAHTATAGREGVSYRVLMFEPPALTNPGATDARLLDALQDGFVQFRTKVRDEYISALVDAIAEENGKGGAISWLVAKGQLCLLLGVMFDRYQRPDSEVTAADRQFYHVLKYIDAHYTEPLSVKGLAGKFSYDPSYFCRKFKQSTGLSPLQYIRILRLERAYSLLRSTDLPVRLVAKQCGYEDANYFSRCFQKRYGTSPVKVRSESASSSIYGR
ncbi:MAG: AraC family transcriptional regulator [Clostridiales bacterium]|nr:AraC family transcriptional regulator [Clostridiales bacterium]